MHAALAATPITVGNPINMDLEDILLWADGTWCYRYELSEMRFMSDDYRTIPVDHPEYQHYINYL